VIGLGLREGPSVPERVRPSRPEPTPPPARRAYFGSWAETPILKRSELARPRTGPLIIEEYDATCVVPPGARAELDGAGNIVIDLD
jgi:N-methylhydantoinase A